VLNLKERAKNLFDMCLQAKEKGHDVFFCYSPHVEMIYIYGYINGRKASEDGKTPKRDIDTYVWLDVRDKENLSKIDEIEEILKGLI